MIKGHSEEHKGAVAHNGISEYDYWTQVNHLIMVPNKTVHFVDRDGVDITGSVYRAATFFPDLIIEEHFNAFNGKAGGVTALACTASKDIANDWCEYTATFLGHRNRRYIDAISLCNGSLNVYSAQEAAPKAILIEPFFGDNPDDYVSVELMAECIGRYLTNL